MTLSPPAEKMRMTGARLSVVSWAPVWAAITHAMRAVAPTPDASLPSPIEPPLFVYNLVRWQSKSQSLVQPALGNSPLPVSGGRIYLAPMPLPQLLAIVESLCEFRELLTDLPGPSDRRGLRGLHGSSDAVVVAAL